MEDAHRRLLVIKTVHTVAWGFFVACIVAIPVVAILDRLVWAAMLSGVVLIEVVQRNALPAHTDGGRSAITSGGFSRA